MKTKSGWRLWGIIVIALLVPIVPFVVIGELPGQQWLQARDQDALLFGLTGSGLLALDIVIPVSSSILGTLLGARLGFLVGFAWAFAGLMAGNVVGYAIGRMLFARSGRPLPDAPTALFVMLSRPIPILAEATTFAAGATRIRLALFLGLTAAGNAVYAAALAASGASLMPHGLVGAGIVAPIAIPAVGWVLWRFVSRR